MHWIAPFGKDAANLCRMKFAVHGLEGDLRHAITYYEDLHQSTGRFDFVLANARFNMHPVDTRADVHDLLRWLAPVRNIELHAEHFRRVQLHRNNRIYTFLLHICEFVHEHWLPAEQAGGRRFRDFIRDGLPALFESFVFNFYRHELAADWHVSAPVLQWQLVVPNADALALVPRMETDVCLRGPGRAIILDTKFYAHALKTARFGGSAKLEPANLYQLFTYLRQQSCESGWEQAEGVLLYPRTTRDFAVEFTTHGHRIRALTLDLAQPWQNIHVALMQIVAAGPCRL